MNARLKPVIAEKAKAKEASHTAQGYQKSENPVHTAKELAKAAGVSHDTIAKVEKIERQGAKESHAATEDRSHAQDRRADQGRSGSADEGWGEN